MHIIHMGMGTWSDEEIISVLACIESIRIKKKNGELYSIEGEELKNLKGESLTRSTENTIELIINDL